MAGTVKFTQGTIIKKAAHPFTQHLQKGINPQDIGEDEEYPQGFKRRFTNVTNQLARGSKTK